MGQLLKLVVIGNKGMIRRACRSNRAFTVHKSTEFDEESNQRLDIYLLCTDPSQNSRTFECFPDPFERPILTIFIHCKFENFVPIFMLADLIFFKRERNVSEHKLLAIYVQKHSFSNIACNLWKIKFSEACFKTSNFFGKF